MLLELDRLANEKPADHPEALIVGAAARVGSARESAFALWRRALRLTRRPR